MKNTQTLTQAHTVFVESIAEMNKASDAASAAKAREEWRSAREAYREAYEAAATVPAVAIAPLKAMGCYIDIREEDNHAVLNLSPVILALTGKSQAHRGRHLWDYLHLDLLTRKVSCKKSVYNINKQPELDFNIVEEVEDAINSIIEGTFAPANPISLDDFWRLGGGQGRHCEFCSYLDVKDEDGDIVFHAEWEHDDDDDESTIDDRDEEQVPLAYAAYLRGEKEYFQGV